MLWEPDRILQSSVQLNYPNYGSICTSTIDLGLPPTCLASSASIDMHLSELGFGGPLRISTLSIRSLLESHK